MRAAVALAFAVVALGSCGGLGAPLGESELTDACITATGCGIVQPSLQSCVDALFGVNLPERALEARITPDQVRCLARAGSNCAAAFACVPGATVNTGNCQNSRCDGTVSHVCFNSDFGGGPNADFDCATVGLQCVPETTTCGTGTCTGNEPFCDGNFNVICDNGAQRKIDCGVVGGTCSDGEGFPNCTGTGDPCTDVNSSTCDGDTLITCLNGAEARTDCGQVGAGCFVGMISGVECGFAADCAEFFQPSCAGRFVVFCNRGKIETVDCIARGFLRGCDSNFFVCSH